MIVPALSVPLKHGEFHVVETARFALAEYTAQFIDIPAASSQQSFHSIFG
jgi:hypothetical protein